MMSKTCMQDVINRRTHMIVQRRRPHVVPDGTGDPNNAYAECEECGQEVYVGTGLHPNLSVPHDQTKTETTYLQRHGRG